MSADPTRRRDVLGCSVAMMLPLVAGVIALWGQRYFPTADGAIIEMQVRDIPSHTPLYGVYSRFGFHHPGPAMFFWLLPFSRIFGLKGVLIGPAVLHVLMFTGCAYVLHRRGGRRLCLLGTSFLLLLERAMIADLLDTWNPWLAVSPFALAVLLAWSVWCRDWWALPWLAGAVSFVVQTHLGYASVAALLVGVAVVSIGRSLLRPPRVPIWPVLATAGVSALAWALPVVEQFTNSTGNFTLILRSLRSPPADFGVAGWGKAFDSITQTMGVRAPWLSGNEELEPFVGRVAGAPWLALLPVTALWVAGSVVARRRGRFEAVALQVISLGLVAVGFVATSRITGEPYPYITRWLWVIAMFIVLSSVWSFLDGWEQPPFTSLMQDRIGTAIVVSLSLVGIGFGLFSDLPRGNHSAGIDQTIDVVVAALRSDDTIQVWYEGPGWLEEQAGFINELDRQGFEVWGPDLPDTEFTLGAHRTRGDRDVSARLIVAIDNPAIDARTTKGQVPIARWDPLSPEDRDTFNNLRLRLAVEYDDALNGRSIANPTPPAERERMLALARSPLPIAVFLERPPPSNPPPP